MYILLEGLGGRDFNVKEPLDKISCHPFESIPCRGTDLDATALRVTMAE